MKIRLLRQSEIEACALVVKLNYGARYSRWAKPELMEMFGTAPILPVYLVVEKGGQILGFGGFMQTWMDYSIYSIFWVNIHPERQREGLGKALVSEMIRRIRKKKHASCVLLTSKTPKYYINNFGFRVLAQPKGTSPDTRLMGLNLND